VNGGTGDKVILSAGTASVHPYSIGVSTAAQWYSVPTGTRHQWYIGGAVGMTLSNNLLGIGTQTPSYNIDVIGKARISNVLSVGDGGDGFPTSINFYALVGMNSSYGTNSNVVIQLGRADANNDSWFIQHNTTALGSASNSFQIVPYGRTPTFSMQANGNIGLGTTTPATRLHIEEGNVFIGDIASGFSTNVPSTVTTSNVASGYRLFFDNSFNNVPGTGVPANKIVMHNNSFTGGFGIENGAVTYHSGENHTFYINANNATAYGSIAMLIGSNVGVGTSNPAHKLDVVGNARIAGTLTLSNATSTVAMAGLCGALSNGVANQNISLSVGKSSSTNNVANIRYTHCNDASACNYIGIGFWANDDLLNVQAGGNVGVGTVSPSSKLDVNGTGNFANRVSVGTVSQGSIRVVGTGDVRYHCYNNGLVTEWLWGQKSGASHSWTLSTLVGANEGDRLTVDNNGNLGVGTTDPSQRLHVIGNILASGDITAFSDKRLKSNIQIIPDALARLHRLGGYTFVVNQKDDEATNIECKITPKHTGLIAQEVLDVLPEAVHKDKEGYYSLAYGNMVGLLVEAVKELDNKYQKIIDEMKADHRKEIDDLISSFGLIAA
jgi:hypothetical protein